MSGKSYGKLQSILPASLAVILFIIAAFYLFIPVFKENLLVGKRDALKQLTDSVWSILDRYHQQAKVGDLSAGEARARALERIRSIRYGNEGKDYFWVIDLQPKMIMHPYTPQLEGGDLSYYTDAAGEKLFVTMVDICNREGHGYVEYMWQWKDDSSRIVPKLSYVRIFKPWKWIIGTGIYLEDVGREINQVTKKIITISILIIGLVSVLLFYLMQRSLRIEKNRQQVTDKLTESEQKYRALVEAISEGTFIVQQNRIIYCNQAVQDLLQYNCQELLELKPEMVFCHDLKKIRGEVESRIKTKNGSLIEVTLSVSDITLGEEKGLIVRVSDISLQKQMAGQLDQSRERYENLTSNLEIGVFRITTVARGEITEANPALLRIFGFPASQVLARINLKEIFLSKQEWLLTIRDLNQKGSIKNRVLQVVRHDGIPITVSLSLVLVKDSAGKPLYGDGLIEDITREKKSLEMTNHLVRELQAAQLFFNESIENYLTLINTCLSNFPLIEAARLMSRKKCGALLVRSDKSKELIGILTDRDIRDWLISGSQDPMRAVKNVMNKPLITIPESAPVFDAINLMKQEKIRHLPAKNAKGEITGVINIEQLLQIKSSSSSFLKTEIERAGSVNEIKNLHKRLPGLVKALIDSGANSKSVCRIITDVSDTVTTKLINYALEKIGPAPVGFVFIALGSEGREEQTLLTDQDNAIIYQDTQNSTVKKDAEEYFLQLGELVSGWLDQCGYSFCAGGIMAKNRQWCQPLSVWKKYFSEWIKNSTPQDLLQINIFFDFRKLYGDKNLTTKLKDFINRKIRAYPPFLLHMVRNALLHKSSLSFFGNILVDSSGDYPSTFDIKDAMLPLVNFARVYALNHNVPKTNTQDRLLQLFNMGVLAKESYQEIIQLYDYLMRIRFKHQAQAIAMNREPDNHINPKTLTESEQKMLKNTFSQINIFQKKLNYDFTGNVQM